jgi:hypothetical protein
MAKNVIAQISGGSKKVLDDVNTVADVKATFVGAGLYTVLLNGNPADDSTPVRDSDHLVLANATKGGN